VVLPAFRSQTGTDVQLVTPGSGIALDMLARGDVDVVISHAPAREAGVMARRTWRYRKIMFNDFVIVGPPDDPAHVLGVPTADVAMHRIAGSGVRFDLARDVFEGDPTLLNTYAVIVPNEASPDALKFADWLVRGDGRRLIEEYPVAGAHAFTVWPPDCPGDVPSALPCAEISAGARR